MPDLPERRVHLWRHRPRRRSRTGRGRRFDLQPDRRDDPRTDRLCRYPRHWQHDRERIRDWEPRELHAGRAADELRSVRPELYDRDWPEHGRDAGGRRLQGDRLRHGSGKLFRGGVRWRQSDVPDRPPWRHEDRRPDLWCCCRRDPEPDRRRREDWCAEQQSHLHQHRARAEPEGTRWRDHHQRPHRHWRS